MMVASAARATATFPLRPRCYLVAATWLLLPDTNANGSLILVLLLRAQCFAVCFLLFAVWLLSLITCPLFTAEFLRFSQPLFRFLPFCIGPAAEFCFFLLQFTLPCIYRHFQPTPLTLPHYNDNGRWSLTAFGPGRILKRCGSWQNIEQLSQRELR